MMSEVTALLLILLGLVMASMGAIVKMVPDWVQRSVEIKLISLERKLNENTKITTEARDLSNGRLHEALKRAEEAERRVREYEDLVNSLRRSPDLAPIIAQYRDRRAHRPTE